MEMAGRTYISPFGGVGGGVGAVYRYGYQAQEKENDIWAGGVSYKYRIEDWPSAILPHTKFFVLLCMKTLHKPASHLYQKHRCGAGLYNKMTIMYKQIAAAHKENATAHKETQQ